jgi:hypothetical protein
MAELNSKMKQRSGRNQNRNILKKRGRKLLKSYKSLLSKKHFEYYLYDFNTTPERHYSESQRSFSFAAAEQEEWQDYLKKTLLKMDESMYFWAPPLYEYFLLSPKILIPFLDFFAKVHFFRNQNG